MKNIQDYVNKLKLDIVQAKYQFEQIFYFNDHEKRAFDIFIKDCENKINALINSSKNINLNELEKISLEEIKNNYQNYCNEPTNKQTEFLKNVYEQFFLSDIDLTTNKDDSDNLHYLKQQLNEAQTKLNQLIPELIDNNYYQREFNNSNVFTKSKKVKELEKEIGKDIKTFLREAEQFNNEMNTLKHQIEVLKQCIFIIQTNSEIEFIKNFQESEIKKDVVKTLNHLKKRQKQLSV